MRIKCLQDELLDPKNTNILNEKGLPMTLQEAFVLAVTLNLDDDRTLNGADKIRLGNLAQKIYFAEGEIDIEKHDFDFVNKRAEKAFLIGLYWAYMNKIKEIEADNADTKDSKKSNPH